MFEDIGAKIRIAYNTQKVGKYLKLFKLIKCTRVV